MKYKINLPEIISTDTAHLIFNSLHCAYVTSFSRNIDIVVFDFSKCKSISPAGLIYIRMWRDRLVEHGKQTFYRKTTAPETDSFLKTMHLIPSTSLTEESAINNKFFYHIHPCKDIYECQSAHKDIISNVVKRENVLEETYCAIDYMINELWDNAGVHGYECYDSDTYPKPVYICALENDNYYEVCIGDRGQGIYNSLQRNNKELQGQNKKDSVRAAIQNGISGHPNGSPGFGLYSAAEFIRGGNGALYIWSSGVFLSISSSGDRISNSQINDGTLVSFVINKNALLPFTETMNKHLVRGHSVEEYIADVIGGLFDEQ